MKLLNLRTVFYALFFGILSGVVVTFALSVFVPQFFPEWAGSLVCPGRVEFVVFKQRFYCYVSQREFFELGDAMFWAVFKRLIIPGLSGAIILALGFVKLVEFLWRRRAAAGF